MPDPESPTFEHVRLRALQLLRAGMYAADGEPTLCRWQEAVAPAHSALYCNALSHLQALEDLLEHATWCDEVEVEASWLDSHESDRLFRLLGIVFLALQECFMEFGLIRRAVDRKQRRLTPSAHTLSGFINHVWKHRDKDGEGPMFHRVHHHGPYLFADAPRWSDALFPDGAYIAMNHRTPPAAVPPLPVVIPSLVDAVDALVELITSTDELLASEGAHDLVSARFGSAPGFD